MNLIVFEAKIALFWRFLLTEGLGVGLGISYTTGYGTPMMIGVLP